MAPNTTQKSTWDAKLFLYVFLCVFGFGALGFFLASAYIVSSQIIGWLEYASWVPYPISDALLDSRIPYPLTPGLLGVQKIIDNVMACPVSLGCFILGILCLLYFGMVGRELHEMQLNERLQRQRALFSGGGAVERD